MESSYSAPAKNSEGSEGPISSRLRRLPGRYLSTSHLPVATPPTPLDSRFKNSLGVIQFFRLNH